MATFTLENPVFAGLAFYGGLSLIKTGFISPLTGFFRMRMGAFANRDDAQLRAKGDEEKLKRMMMPNEYVERVRRAHLNDLENVVPFVVVGLLYCGTNPSPDVALNHFRIFFAARLLHTIVYLTKIRQPARALCFFAGFATFVSMSVRVVLSAM